MYRIDRAIKILVLGTALASGAAFADNATTADRTYNELIAAQKSGDVVLYLGKTARELFPNLYPADAHQAPAKTVEQVRAELLKAQNSGDVVVYLGMTGREISPNRYPMPALAAPGKTRAQVLSELSEEKGIASGDLPWKAYRPL